MKEGPPVDHSRLILPIGVLIVYVAFMLWLGMEYRRQTARTDAKWDSLRTSIYMDAMSEVQKSKEDTAE